MNRTDIETTFRSENPELTERVLSTLVLNVWIKEGNLEIAIRTRCITGEFTFTTVADEWYRDLTAEESKFYDVDDLPGGGVEYDGKRLGKTSMAKLSTDAPTWRSRSSAVPSEYFRRGKYLWWNKPALSAVTARVYCILIPDAFDSDEKIPFNELSHLEGFHYSLVKYLQMRAKAKIGKEGEAAKAQKEYADYLRWFSNEVRGERNAAIYFRPRG